jgi:hypothetical protein
LEFFHGWGHHEPTAFFDVFPRLSDLSQFRVRASAFWETTLDPKQRVFLRLDIQDRSDSDPVRDRGTT